MPIDNDVINSRIAEAKEAINELLRLTSKPFSELSIEEKYSIKYNIILLVESLISLCIHIAKERYDFVPKSYVDTVRFVAEKLGLKCVNDLVALVRLRNMIIHRYWIVDDYKIYVSIKNDFECVEKLLKNIKGIKGE